MAEITKNPRLLKIHFYFLCLRHWKAGREYERTSDIYTVENRLGHKALGSTDRYQHSKFQSEEYVAKWAKSKQEEEKLNNAGF
jgi:integrase